MRGGSPPTLHPRSFARNACAACHGFWGGFWEWVVAVWASRILEEDVLGGDIWGVDVMSFSDIFPDTGKNSLNSKGSFYEREKLLRILVRTGVTATNIYSTKDRILPKLLRIFLYEEMLLKLPNLLRVFEDEGKPPNRYLPNPPKLLRISAYKGKPAQRPKTSRNSANS